MKMQRKTSLPKSSSIFATKLQLGFERMTGITDTGPHVEKLVNWATSYAGDVAVLAVRSVIGIVIGLAIMVVALYYFLADGPGMIRALMQLSPLDARYEQELLERFGSVSRAVVVAILLSALVQGSFAGIGYYLALPAGAPIFLLTLLTMICAMIPFVGAGLVWVPVCLWVLFYGEQIINGQVMHDGNTLTAVLSWPSIPRSWCPAWTTSSSRLSCTANQTSTRC